MRTVAHASQPHSELLVPLDALAGKTAWQPLGPDMFQLVIRNACTIIIHGSELDATYL